MTVGDEFLDRLAPAHAWVPDWPDVLERAEESRSTRLFTKRRLILALALAAAVLVPLAALASANDWWFLGWSGAPKPTAAPVVVKEGQWDGHPWQIIAFPSTTDGLCFVLTFPVTSGSTASGKGAAMNCAPFAGIPRTSETKQTADLTITYMSGSASKDLPAHIEGPVIDAAATVEINFGNGEIVRVPTFAAPPSFEHVRFYATQLPKGVVTRSPPVWLAGVDANGHVVACLASHTAKDGISPLSDCH